jgi:hypothetical protein
MSRKDWIKVWLIVIGGYAAAPWIIKGLALYYGWVMSA